jgi:hypothetical protein
VLHSRTKHIEVRYHFLRDNVEKGNIDLIHVPTEKQLADILTKPLDQATFARLRGELGVVFLFQLRLAVWCTYACCIFHLCIISSLHLCIIDYNCMLCSRDVLLLYTLITMICWIWAYDLLVMLMWCIAMLLIALGCICLWMAYFCKNTIHDPHLWVESLSCSNCALMTISCLICAWNHVLLIWGQRPICHHKCLSYMLPCGEA